MSVGLMKGLDTPELKKKPSQFTAKKKSGNKHNLSGTRCAAVVKADPAVAPHVVTLTLMEGMGKC
jgi:hypothetical protein